MSWGCATAVCRSSPCWWTSSGGPGRTPTPGSSAGALLANLYGIAQLWTWGSLQLTTGADDFAPLLHTALDAHLGGEER